MVRIWRRPVFEESSDKIYACDLKLCIKEFQLAEKGEMCFPIIQMSIKK